LRANIGSETGPQRVHAAALNYFELLIWATWVALPFSLCRQVSAQVLQQVGPEALLQALAGAA